MVTVHEKFTLEGNIGELEAAIQSVTTGKEWKTGVAQLLCPVEICGPLQYKFPIPPGQTSDQALLLTPLPRCEHGTRVLPE